MYRLCGRTVLVFGILAMALYLGNGRDVLKMALSNSIQVSENAQKNLGDSTHPIDST